MHTNVNGLYLSSSYKYNTEELLIVIEENVHFAKHILFEMLHYNELASIINMNVMFWEEFKK